MPTRFFNYFAFAVKKDIGVHEKSLLEKAGDLGLWTIEEFPKKVWKMMKDPVVITVALTAIALVGVTLAFYPVTTVLAAKAALLLLPQVPFWAVKFSAWVGAVGLILSTSMRALGRVTNLELRAYFEHNNNPSAAVLEEARRSNFLKAMFN